MSISVSRQFFRRNIWSFPAMYQLGYWVSQWSSIKVGQGWSKHYLKADFYLVGNSTITPSPVLERTCLDLSLMKPHLTVYLVLNWIDITKQLETLKRRFWTKPRLCTPKIEFRAVFSIFWTIRAVSRSFPVARPCWNSHTLTSTSQEAGLCIWEHFSSRQISDSPFLVEAANWQVISNIYN